MPYRIEFSPIPLEADFPIFGRGPRYRHDDHPITYLHVHQALEIGYCHSGSGVFIVAEKVMRFVPGSISVITAAEPHLACSTPKTDSYWTWITVDPVRLLGPMADARMLDPSPLAGPDFANILTGEKAKTIGPLILRLIEELNARGPHHRAAIKALVWLILVELKRLAPKLPARKETPALPSSHYLRIAPALDYLARHHAEPLRVGDLARRCGLSEPHFRRLFSQAVGKSPQAYWLHLRLQMACSLLRATSLSILKISQESGFETLSSFNRAFRKAFRATPRDWRRKA